MRILKSSSADSVSGVCTYRRVFGLVVVVVGWVGGPAGLVVRVHGGRAGRRRAAARGLRRLAARRAQVPRTRLD